MKPDSAILEYWRFIPFTVTNAAVFVELNKKAIPISRSFKKEVLHRLENL